MMLLFLPSCRDNGPGDNPVAGETVLQLKTPSGVDFDWKALLQSELRPHRLGNMKSLFLLKPIPGQGSVSCFLRRRFHLHPALLTLVFFLCMHGQTLQEKCAWNRLSE